MEVSSVLSRSWATLEVLEGVGDGDCEADADVV